MDIVEKLLNLDRRWVFLLIAVSVALPLLFPFPLPITGTPPSQGFYDAIENLPPGSTVLISADYDAGSEAEIRPMHKAVLEHCGKKGHKVIQMGLWPAGFPISETLLEEILEAKYGMEYGEDFILFPYVAGQVVVIKSIGKSFAETFKEDRRNGQPLNDSPIMNGVRNIGNVDLAITLSAGFPGIPEWVQVAADQFGAEVIGGCTAVSAPQLYPYFPNQLKGLLGGLKGAAEYEDAVGVPDAASAGMTAQSLAHLVIIMLIIVGNITYFIHRQRQRRY